MHIFPTLRLILNGLVLIFLLGSCKKVMGPKGDPGPPGSNGADGYTSLIKITPFASNTFCLGGGINIESGIDKNKNNILDSLEIDQNQFVCNGGAQDNLIFLPIPNSSANTTSQTPVITGELIKFKKSDYPGVDSILFVANPYVGDITDSSVVQLYNVTDGQLIAGSVLSSNSLYGMTFLQSGNLYNNIPDKEITLGISLYSAKTGFFAGSGSIYLFLYRH